MASVFDQLDRDWGRVADLPAVARRLHGACTAAGGAATLADVERFVRSASPEDADRVLAALVAEAVDDGEVPGDRLAARALLQLLLPGVRRLARTWWALGDPDERAAAAVAAVYDRIRRYPLARRPQRIAANVLMDAAGDLRRAARSAQPVSDSGHLPTGEWDLPSPAVTHPALELVDALADAVGRGLVSPEDAGLIAESRIAGTSLREIARQRGAKLRTLQWRRQRAEALLVGAGL
jgi:hypothetical protein